MVIEKLAERRNRLLLINAASFVVWQASAYGKHVADWPGVPVFVTVSISAFVIWAWSLRAVMRPVGDARTQAALNDELTQQHRQQAMLAGYWAMLLGAAAASSLPSLAGI